MGRVSRRTVLFLTGALIILNFAEAASVNINGSWLFTINQTNLQGQAGTDLVSSYQSPAGQITMDMAPGGKKGWNVSVFRLDTSWNANFVLQIMRTGTGSGTGTVSGGTTYLTITTINQTFVTGTGVLSGIPLMEQLTGVSVSIPAATYTTTIQFTATDM